MTKYLLIALAIAGALLSFASWQLWESWKREAAIRGEYEGFKAEVEAKGEKAGIVAKAEDSKRKENANATRLEMRRLNALIVGLRDRPSVRPDGSSVSVTPPCPSGVDRPAGEWVSLTDYRALEQRAREDAARLMGWEKWRIDNNIPVAGDEHDVMRWKFARDQGVEGIGGPR